MDISSFISAIDTRSYTLSDMFDNLLLWLGNLSLAYRDPEMHSNASKCPSLAEFLERMLSTIDNTICMTKKVDHVVKQHAILSVKIHNQEMKIDRLKLLNIFQEHDNCWNQFVVLSGLRNVYDYSMDVLSSRLISMCVMIDLYNDYFLDNFAEMDVSET